MAGRETPATQAARDAGVPFTVHEYRRDPRADPYAGEAADTLGLDPHRIFKTLVVNVGDAGGISLLGRRRALATYVDGRAVGA